MMEARAGVQNGLGDVGVLEHMAGVGKRVEVRCLRPVASVTPHRVPSLLVAHDEDKVASGHRGCSSWFRWAVINDNPQAYQPGFSKIGRSRSRSGIQV